MYRFELKTFIAAAECGSFNSASERAFISPTAIMKQINQLEGQLGLKLFNRTNHGLQLTAVGKIFLKEAYYIVSYCDGVVKRLQDLQGSAPRVIRVGTSMLNPCKPFMDLWNKVADSFPQMKIQVIPFEDTARGISDVIAQIGSSFDFIVGPMNSLNWFNMVDFLQLGTYKKMIAVPASDPLANKAELSLEDLHGRMMAMLSRGDSPVNDNIRDFLEKEHPEISLLDMGDHYDISVFNWCAENDILLLNMECWKDIHPALVTLPVRWDFALPYGLLYSKKPSCDALVFLEALKATLEIDDLQKEATLV